MAITKKEFRTEEDFFPSRKLKKEPRERSFLQKLGTPFQRLLNSLNTRIAVALSRRYLKSVDDLVDRELKAFSERHPGEDSSRLKAHLLEEHERVVPIAASMVITQLKAANLRFALGVVGAVLATAITGGAGIGIIAAVLSSAVLVNYGVAFYQSKVSFGVRYKAGISGKAAIYEEALLRKKQQALESKNVDELSNRSSVETPPPSPRQEAAEKTPDGFAPVSVNSTWAATAWKQGVINLPQLASRWDDNIQRTELDKAVRRYVAVDGNERQVVWLHPSSTQAEREAYKAAADKEQWLKDNPALWVRYHYENGVLQHVDHGSEVAHTVIPQPNDSKSLAFRIIDEPGQVHEIPVNKALVRAAA